MNPRSATQPLLRRVFRPPSGRPARPGAAALGIVLLAVAIGGAHGAARADEPMRPLPLGPRPSDPAVAPSPSTDAARRAQEKVTTHREIESRRAADRLDRIDRQVEAETAQREAARPAPVAPGERERTEPGRLDAAQNARADERRLELDRELAEVDRWLARDDLGPATRSAVERYRNELLGQRATPESSP